MAQAAIVLTQGATTDVAGRSLVVSTTGGSVTATNGDDTGIVSWLWELLETPPGSSISPSSQGPGAISSFVMAQPDVPGCYRIRLTVADAEGNSAQDIRNAAVPFPNGLICPPYQGNPLPLPLAVAPDEMNFGGQNRGWMGDVDPARKLLYYALQVIDRAAPSVIAPGFTLAAWAPVLSGWEIATDGQYLQSSTSSAGNAYLPLALQFGASIMAIRLHVQRMAGGGANASQRITGKLQQRDGGSTTWADVAGQSFQTWAESPAGFYDGWINLPANYTVAANASYRLVVTGETGTNAQQIKLLDVSMVGP